MIVFGLAVLAVFILLLISEYLWRRRNYHPEITRKFAHITVGSLVAFWPFFLSWHQIEILSLAFLVVVGLSRYFRIFRAIHSVQRPTWGEVFFAAIVGLLAVLGVNKWVYAAALLQMSLADGLAAIIGTKYGKKGQYKIFGYTKSVIGTATFFAVSLLIVSAYIWFSGVLISPSTTIILAAALAAIENIAPNGFDNLFVPLLAALVLR